LCCFNFINVETAGLVYQQVYLVATAILPEVIFLVEV
jgi:hypothetical protein